MLADCTILLSGHTRNKTSVGHVVSRILLAPDTLDTSNYLRRFSTHFSWSKCMMFCAGLVFFCHRFKIHKGPLCKFIAKLRLLDHGLLLAANTLDDFHMESRRSKGDDGADEEDFGEPFEAFEARVNAFVAISISAASSSKRDNYKDSLVYAERRNVIQQFLKSIISKKCPNPNCGA